MNTNTIDEFNRKIFRYTKTEITGKEFNNLSSNIEFVKLTNEKERHTKFQFHDGPNVDIYKSDYDSNGFSFTPKYEAERWICCDGTVMHHMRTVTIPDHAKVFIEDASNFKTDEFILGPKRPIDVNIYLEYVKIWCLNKERMNILFEVVDNWYFRLCAIKMDCNNLMRIPHDKQNEMICRMAINSDIRLIEYVRSDILGKIYDHENKVIIEEPAWYDMTKFIRCEMSGKEFNDLFPDILPIKLTNETEKHRDYQFHDGLNIDHHEFDHTVCYTKGGFYFTTKQYAHKWIYYGYQIMTYVRKVTIPDDARVYIENKTEYKTDKFILGEKEVIYKKVTMF